MRRPVLALLVVAFALMGPGAVGAQESECACGSMTDAQALERATYVFEGRAVAPVQLVIPEGSSPADGWSFVVTGVAKGRVGPEQLVAVPPSAEPCSVSFERDSRYLVLADDDRADLPAAVVAVDACSGTRLASAGFDQPLTFAVPEPLPVDADALAAGADPLLDGASGDRLTARAVLVFVLIVGGAGAISVWIWRGRTSAS